MADQVIGILLQVCDALIAAHATGIIHRDLKLDNVFLIDNPDDPKQPRVKLLDWGIAKVIVEDGHRKTLHHTIDGQLVGTPQYLAPEQARGDQVSSKTDVYSLGVMAYELFLEQLPFEAETAAEIMTMHLRATPPPASDAWPDIPTSLEELLHEMLAKQPGHRPSMLDVARRLEAVREELEVRRRNATQPAVTVTPVAEVRLSSQALLPPPTPARQRWQWVVGAAALVASATLLLISEVIDSADASATTLDPIGELVAPPAPAPAPLPAAAAPPPVPLTPVTVDTPPTLLDVLPVSIVTPPTKIKPARRAARPVPAAPRRNAKLDPDGTFDPYR